MNYIHQTIALGFATEGVQDAYLKMDPVLFFDATLDLCRDNEP